MNSIKNNWVGKFAGGSIYDAALRWRINFDKNFGAKRRNAMSSELLEKPGRDLRNKKGFGLNEVIGIAAGIIIAALVVIPGLRNFAEGLMSSLDTWWGNMSSEIFNQT